MLVHGFEFAIALKCFAERHSLFDAADLLETSTSNKEPIVSDPDDDHDLKKGNNINSNN